MLLLAGKICYCPKPFKCREMTDLGIGRPLHSSGSMFLLLGRLGALYHGLWSLKSFLFPFELRDLQLEPPATGYISWDYHTLTY